jgi:hypothetical protein
MKSSIHLSYLSKIAIALLLLISVQCREEEFGRKLLVTTNVYDGEKVMDPIFSGEILGIGKSPVAQAVCGG